MKNFFCFFLLSLCLKTYSQIEMKYNESSAKMPDWAKVMYSEETEVAEEVEL